MCDNTSKPATSFLSHGPDFLMDEKFLWQLPRLEKDTTVKFSLIVGPLKSVDYGKNIILYWMVFWLLYHRLFSLFSTISCIAFQSVHIIFDGGLSHVPQAIFLISLSFSESPNCTFSSVTTTIAHVYSCLSVCAYRRISLTPELMWFSFTI